MFSKVNEALKVGQTSDDLDANTKAKAHRARGGIAERAGDPQGAYNAWSRALKLDPRVGIKRRHNTLGKMLKQ